MFHQSGAHSNWNRSSRKKRHPQTQSFLKKIQNLTRKNIETALYNLETNLSTHAFDSPPTKRSCDTLPFLFSHTRSQHTALAIPSIIHAVRSRHFFHPFLRSSVKINPNGAGKKVNGWTVLKLCRNWRASLCFDLCRADDSSGQCRSVAEKFMGTICCVCV